MTAVVEPDMESTAAAMADPRAGDVFTEMYAFWVYVLEVTDARVAVLEFSAPGNPLRDGRLIYMGREQFQNWYRYRTIPGYWVRLSQRDKDVAGWLEELEQRNDP